MDFRIKLKAYEKLIKFKVDIIVALTGVFGYFFGMGELDWTKILWLFLGGFFITGSAHIINQIIERNFDKKMPRTANRPLALETMSLTEAVLMIVLFCSLGFYFLYEVHPLSAFVSFVSLIIYGFLYTPMKRLSRLSIYIGAIPGALPVLIGYLAAEGTIDSFAILLFLMQLFWQLPHSWSIAWYWYDDYSAGGYDLLPVKGGKNKINALLTFLSVFFLFPLIYMLYQLNVLHNFSLFIILFLTIIFVYTAFLFYKKRNRQAARTLMLSSIVYLPVIQLIIIFNLLNNN